ncbi:MAG TPA: AraC family transcriptional regulator [Chitinophagaceae bacterium]|nr:AraC family transcriptional regulator [Chitinophagaceae bacterium]
MPVPTSLIPGGHLDFKLGLPPNYTGKLLPGAVASFAKTNTASIITQVVAGDMYNVRYSISRFFENMKGLSRVTTPGFYNRFQLKSSQRFIINDADRLHLRQDQFCGLWINEGSCNTRFQAGKEYHELDLYYSPEMLEEFRPAFPELRQLLEGAAHRWLPGCACWTMPAMNVIIEELLNCPYDALTRHIYFDLKVREMLTLILDYHYKRRVTLHPMTPWQSYRIHQVKKILEEYIASKPPTLRTLARKVALNQTKVKEGFRQLFNCGIFEWLMEAKMNKARELLLTTDKPVGEIGNMVGYPRLSNFITAYRRRFGQTPGSMRR